MGFFKEFFAKRDEEAARAKYVTPEMGQKTQEALDSTKPAEERRKAFQEAKTLKAQKENIERDSKEMLKLKMEEMNQAERDKLGLGMTREKIFKQGVDITDEVEEDQKAA